MPAIRLAARSSSPLPVLPNARTARALSPLPALAIAPIVPDIPAVEAIYYPCIVAQHTSNDLVIYTRDLGRVITIAYPLSPFGVRIVPSGIFRWMERRGLVFECFCALVSRQPTPARFIDEFLSGHTVVRCHYIDNHCGFYLDLTKIYGTTMYDSSYKHLLTLTSGAPDIHGILARWHRLVRRDVALLQHPAPFVAEYFSIHVSLYPGIMQLRSGLSRPLTPTSIRHHPYHRGRATQSTNNRVSLVQLHQPRHNDVAIAGPSTRVTRPINRFSERETDALDALKMGFGVSPDQIEDLFEQCDHCSQSFIRSALRVHIKDVEDAGQHA